MKMGVDELEKVRDILLELPYVSEKTSPGGAICFFILDNKTKKTLCYFHNSHHDGRVSLWCPAYQDLKKDLIQNRPGQFFQPHTSSGGNFGEWLGIYLDAINESSINWVLISKILVDAFRKIASKKLVNKLKVSR